MKGTQKIEVIARNLHYTITLERNVTVITGETATGKSTFRKFIQKYKKSSGGMEFKLKASCAFAVLQGDWDIDSLAIKGLRDTIVIIDEDAGYLRSTDFASLVKGSSNYFLLIYRGALPNLSYSYKSVYKLHTVEQSGKYFTTNLEYFGNTSVVKDISLIIPEDSNSGKEMLSTCFSIEVEDIEKGGNGTLYARACSAIKDGQRVLIFADGAALGGYITKLRNLLVKYPHNSILWCPESFEYLLLESGIVFRNDVPLILADPSQQIESALFISWERFFTWLVQDIMNTYPGCEYHKKHLSDWYLQSANIAKFKSVVPDEVKYLLE